MGEKRRRGATTVAHAGRVPFAGRVARAWRVAWVAKGARLACAGVVAVALAGCGAEEPASDASPAGYASRGGAPTSAALRPLFADDVRRSGTPSGVGGLTVLSLGGEPRTGPGGVGAELWVWTGDGGVGETGPVPPVALVAPPVGATFEAQPDGSVVVRGSDGSVLAGVAPVVGGAVRVTAGDLLAVSRPVGSTAERDLEVRFGGVGTESATWGENEGGRSLAVVPTAWAREAGAAGVAVVWQEIGRLAPAEATPGMRDQLVCHAVGAPDKASWNLEPWRPDVGLLGVLAALCNPE